MSTNQKQLRAVVLAAGQGKRLQTEGCDLPKVMRLACNRPLLSYVLAETSFISPAETIIVVGYKKERIISAFPGYVLAEQLEQKGTGHAVMAAMPALGGFEGDILVCYGDMPLLTRETYLALIEEHRASGNDCTLLSGTTDRQLPYGRIIRDENGCFAEVVEDRDCTPEQSRITELNTGLYVFDRAGLETVLKELRPQNSQGEYYLTDAPALMLERGMRVGVCKRELGIQILGVNTQQQLDEVEEEIIRISKS